jgi:NAD(P)-dependent dehydrogenase (short-subunit alcohol dehydrogenase family)
MTVTVKTALITGGAGGLGYAMAQALAADGVNTAIFDIREQAAALAGAPIGWPKLGKAVVWPD